MENIIFVLAFSILSFNFYMASYRITGINRMFYSIPIALFEASIPIVQEKTEENIVIYYDKELIRDKLTSYLNKHATKYCSSYNVEILFYNQDDYSYCLTDQCDAVEVTLNAQVLLTYEYSKTARFYIQDNR